MAKPDTTTARSPRGAKPVSQAFFTTLESIPEATRPAVTKAALAMIRDQIKVQREKVKAVAAKEKAAAAKAKASKSVTEKPVAKAGPKAKSGLSASKTAPAKRRATKPADVPVAA